MYELGVVYRNIGRVERDVAARLGTFGTATVHEAIGRTGLLKTYMRPIYAGAQASGTACWRPASSHAARKASSSMPESATCAS
jgi:hypothetical protein